ncbi:MAG: hypothetical protein NVV62_16715 [Terricaulis sp.]|nr:hypothetical protein [Terricaulis sp.]
MVSLFSAALAGAAIFAVMMMVPPMMRRVMAFGMMISVAWRIAGHGGGFRTIELCRGCR